MKNKYLVYGVAICLFTIWANHRGWRPINDFLFAATVWQAAGPGGFHK